MSQPLALIGPAVVEVIGVSPTGFGETMEAGWARHSVFGADMHFQPISGGENVETLQLAARPHVHGGLQNYRLLRELNASRQAVPFLRMSGIVGSYHGLVAVQRISRDEQRISPLGAGWRWEFTVELLYLGRNLGAGF